MVTLTGINNADRAQAYATILAVQLLATCFTLPPEVFHCSPPSPVYYDPKRRKLNPPDARLISCLRLHAQYRDAPAFGHNARNSSFALSWSGEYIAPSREELLAEEVSRRRRAQQTPKAANRQGPLRSSRRSWSDNESETGDRSVDTPALRPYWRRYQSSAEMTTLCKAPFQRRRLDRIFGRPWRFGAGTNTPVYSTSRSNRSRPSRPTSMLNLSASLKRHRDGSAYTHRWSFQPILRSEAHPVFIQPIKEHIIRRWRAFRSRTSSPSSASNSDESFFTRSPRWNGASEVCSAGSPLVRSRQSEEPSTSTPEPSAPDAALLSLPVSAESVEPSSSLLTTSEASTGLPTNVSPSLTSSSPLSSAQDESPNVHNTTPANATSSSYFPPFLTPHQTSTQTKHPPKGRPQRSSTVGTILFSPPVIAQASPNSEKVVVERTRSSSGSASGLGLGVLHFL